MTSPSTDPLVGPPDPVAAIRSIQRAKQRFVPGLLATLPVALVVMLAWTFSGLGTLSPVSKLRIAGAMIVGGLVGLPMRLIGRAVELKLGIWAGGLAVLAIAFGDLIVQVATKAAVAFPPQGSWFAALVTYGGVLWVATVTARRELDVSLSLPGQRGEGVAVPAPAIHEDPLAVVLEEPASIWRGWQAVPGTLRLTGRELMYFDKNAPAPSWIVPLGDVASASQGLQSSAFVVTPRTGKATRFVVFDRDKWIVQINARLR